MVIQTCLNVTLYVRCLVKCVLVDFRHGAPNYRKTPYIENPKNQALWIKGPILVRIYTLTPSLYLVASTLYWMECVSNKFKRLLLQLNAKQVITKQNPQNHYIV